MSLWSPELGKPHTVVIVGEQDTLPTWAVERLRDLVTSTGHPPVSVTAEGLGSLPSSMSGLVGAVVPVPPLRERPADVLPLARYAAARVRGREVDFTPAAEHALASCGWPDNVGQLMRVVREAAAQSEVVDVRHLPSEVLSGSHRRLTGIEAFERDEIVRRLSMPRATVTSAASELGMSRATIYRKIAQYEIRTARS
jgi:transcriptional regulator with AAA-type ATPase domain